MDSNTAAEKTKLWTLSSDCSRITAKPTMEKPIKGHGTRHGDCGCRDCNLYRKELTEYRNYLASLPSYVAIGFDKSDVGRDIPESEIRWQHQFLHQTNEGKTEWANCSEEHFNWTNRGRRIVAYKSSLPKEQGEESPEAEAFVKKHLAIIRDKVLDNLIELHIARMSELEKASVKYFLESGTVNGSFHSNIKKVAESFAKNWGNSASTLHEGKEAIDEDKFWWQIEETIQKWFDDDFDDRSAGDVVDELKSKFNIRKKQ